MTETGEAECGLPVFFFTSTPRDLAQGGSEKISPVFWNQARPLLLAAGWIEKSCVCTPCWE